jgi:hypothetical protein
VAATAYIDPDTAWRFEYEGVANFGVVLTNLAHENYRLGQDIRLSALWIGWQSPEDPSAPPPEKLRLASSPLVELAAPAVNKSPPLPPDFGFYRMLTSVSAKYGGALRDGSYLTIWEDFEFAPWGMNPPHEPGGVLNAARLIPLLSFEHTTKTGGKPLRYLRFDYRLNHALDVFDPSPRVLPAGPPALNQAGVFRDNEVIAGPGVVVTPFPQLPVVPTPPRLVDVFAAGEKPLQYELLGKALVHGKPFVGTSPATWDNVHQWPLSNAPLPSTPGAFHCCHTHWRWGAVAGALPNFFTKNLLKAGGQPQFKGLRWSSSQGGPLLDSRLPDQSITLAVTNDVGPARAASADSSVAPFSSQFTGTPQPISAGANLIQWFCIEVFRDAQDTADTWRGSVFVHGLYFAHSTEPTSLQSVLINLRDPLQNPKPTQTWQRAAV